MRWLPYQVRWLSDRAMRRAIVKARRVGFSEVLTFEIACRALGIDLLLGTFCKPTNQHLLSASFRQSVDLLARAKKHLLFLMRGGAFPGAKLVTDSKTEIRLWNGVVLRAYSTNPDSIRGEGGDLTIDEAGAIRNPKELMRAAIPLANPHIGNPDGYRVSICGTPEGDASWFYDVIEGNESGNYSQHKVDIYQAIADGFPITPEKLAAMKSDSDPEYFAQEYETKFLSASSRYISAELWDSRAYGPEEGEEDGKPFEIPLGADIFAGFDIGRKHDRSALAKLAEVDSTLWQPEPVRVEQGMKFELQEKWLDREMDGDRYSIRRIAVDETGMGAQFAEQLEDRWGDSRVERITFTAQSKEVLCTGMKLALERKILRPRRDDLRLRRDVLLLRRTVSDGGAVKFDAERTKYGHADCAWAMALATKASGLATRQVTPAGVMPGVTTRQDDDAMPHPSSGRGMHRRGAWMR